MKAKWLKLDKGYWYMATPYSTYPSGIDRAFIDAAIAAGEFIKHGINVYSPITHTHPIAVNSNMDPYSHDIWMPLDEQMMENAHGLIVLKMPNWQASKGISMEVEFFTVKFKPIIYMEYPLDL